jgi:hypothetical protein
MESMGGKCPEQCPEKGKDAKWVIVQANMKHGVKRP